MIKKKKNISFSKRPITQGLYDSNFEHDACGIGFVANIKGNKEHSIILDGLKILDNLTHRGAVGADPTLGDGAGLLLQIPDKFLREECKKEDVILPYEGSYAVAQIFFPNDNSSIAHAKEVFKKVLEDDGLEIIYWRKVPVNEKAISKSLNSTAPIIEQAFVVPKEKNINQDELEKNIFIVRKILSNK